MTRVYDEMSPRSYPDYAGGTAEQRSHRQLLRHEMEKQGFTVFPRSGGISIIGTGRNTPFRTCLSSSSAGDVRES